MPAVVVVCFAVAAGDGGWIWGFWPLMVWVLILEIRFGG